MKLNSKVILSFALLALSISCSQQVEKNKLRGQYEAYDPKSGDAQGAVVQLAGVVTELEDVDNKEKKVGLSVGSDEVVVLETGDKKTFTEGDLVQVKAVLVGKLGSKIRIFKPLEFLKKCGSEKKDQCFKTPFFSMPVVFKGVLKKIEKEQSEPILTLINDDKVVQVLDPKSILADKKEGDEIAVGGYFKSKISQGVSLKSLVVRKLIEADKEVENTIKELSGKFVKTYKKGPHFLTDEGKLIALSGEYDDEIFFGEDAKAKIKFVKKGLKGRIPFDRLLSDFLDKFSKVNNYIFKKRMSLIKVNPQLTRAYVQSVDYVSCNEENPCSQDKVALLGYHLTGEKDILFLGFDSKKEMDLSAVEEEGAEKEAKNLLS